MADYFIDKESLVAIADAIREQLDASGIIYPGDMPEKIHNDLGNVKVIVERTNTEIKHNDVDVIADYAFYSYPTLITASFPRCTTIGANAFNTCVSLETVYFPMCTTTGASAFAGCTKIKNATIGFSEILSTTFPFKPAISTLENINLIDCTNIGASAFYNYKKLSSIYLAASKVVTLAHSNAFAATPMSNSTYLSGVYGSIYVPQSLVTSYKNSPNWTYYSNRITYIK